MFTPDLDSSQAAREARRLASQLQDELTTRLGRLVGEVPEPRLRQVMRTPLRRPVLDTVFWGLPRVLAGTRASEVTTLIGCHITGRPDGNFDAYWLEFTDGRWTSGRGAPAVEPKLTITVDAAELLLLASGRSNFLQAYLAGNLRAGGNPMLAARLTMLFRGPPSPTPA
jgi:SCP-2 sterol transfer family protein